MDINIKKLFNSGVEKIGGTLHKSIPVFRRVWSGYGYYISLAALLVMFGAVAYMYRSGSARTANAVHSSYNAQPAMARVASSPAPTPSPEPENAFIMPLSGDVIGEYSADKLAWNAALGQWRIHPGIDIKAAAGTAVMACADGVVTDAYEDSLYGNIIEITHENGIITRYCTLATLEMVEIGNRVRKGEFIGSVGEAPLIESDMEAHLHFEMLENGAYIAPAINDQSE